MTKVRGQYPPEFKLRAVAMMTEQGLSVAEVARQLGVSESRLHEWKKAVREKGPPPSRVRPSDPVGGGEPAVAGRRQAARDGA